VPTAKVRGRPWSLVFTGGVGKPRRRKSNFIRRDFNPLLRRADLPEVDFHSAPLLLELVPDLIEEGADTDPLLVALRDGASTPMVLDTLRSPLRGARRQAAAGGMDRAFGGVVIGHPMVVKIPKSSAQTKTPIPNPL